MITMNTPVSIITGHHAGERGTIISLPLSKSQLYVVLLESGTGLVASPDEFQPIEPVQEETQHARIPCP